jgi:pimeloyl-ACP methyl ester carboxylesterase
LFGIFADRCARVADGLGYEGFHVFGWIGGTHVALRCAIEFPHLVRSLTLLGPFHPLADMRLIEKQLEFRRVMLTQPDRELYAF